MYYESGVGQIDGKSHDCNLMNSHLYGRGG